MINRRSLITGLISFAATAPAIVRVESLMKLPAPRRLLTPEEIIEAMMKSYCDQLEKAFANTIIYGVPYYIRKDKDTHELKIGNSWDYYDYTRTDSR